MTKLITSVLAALALLMGAGQAKADMILGPTYTGGGGGGLVLDNSTGLVFYANTDSVLTSFVYNNQGYADTIVLASVAYPLVGKSPSIYQTIYDSVNTPANQTSYTVNVNWNLTAGTEYVLSQLDGNDLLRPQFGAQSVEPNYTMQYSDFFGFPVSDADITIQSDVFAFDQVPIVGENGVIWVDFNDITTVTAAVPEPSSLILLALVIGVVGFGTRLVRRRKPVESAG